MATDFDIAQLIEEAQRLGKHRTKKDAVTAALDEYILRRKQMRIFELVGKVEFDPAYDYKAERRRAAEKMESRLGLTSLASRRRTR